MMRTWHKAAACMTLATCVSTIAGIAPAGAAPGLDRQDRDTDWRRVATIADRGRLRGWREAWIGALAQVDPREIRKEPVLFDPDRSLADPLPPPGNYRCRTFKLGSRAGIGPTFMASGWFACRIGGSVYRGGDGDREDVDGGGNSVVSLTKLDGSQRPVGTIFADTNARAIFLGTMELGDEKRPMRYGRDATRDMAGLIERIGTKRWRVVLPYPKFESVLDVVELVPAD